MRHISVWRRVVLGAILAASFSYAHAAEINAHIKGTVTDPTGAVVAKASVIVTNEAPASSTPQTTFNGRVSISFPRFPIGTYTVNVVCAWLQRVYCHRNHLNIAQEYVEAV